MDTILRKVATYSKPFYLRSGELAKATGVSTDTLRHYERMGLLPCPPRTTGGYRQYPIDSVDRVRIIRRALAIGFNLTELTRILRVRDRGGAPCRQVHAIAVGKLAQLDQRIADLKELRQELEMIVTQWESRLGETPEGQRAGLLEGLLRLPSQTPPITAEITPAEKRTTK